MFVTRRLVARIAQSEKHHSAIVATTADASMDDACVSLVSRDQAAANKCRAPASATVVASASEEVASVTQDSTGRRVNFMLTAGGLWRQGHSLPYMQSVA